MLNVVYLFGVFANLLAFSNMFVILFLLFVNVEPDKVFFGSVICEFYSIGGRNVFNSYLTQLIRWMEEDRIS